MAGYECSLCDPPEPATILITPLTGGETMAIGPACMAVAFAGMLAGHLGVDADKLYQAAERLQRAQAKRAAQAVDGTEDAAADGQAITLAPVPDVPDGAEGGES